MASSQSVTNDTLSDLHSKKLKAIDSLDFETAEKCSKMIANTINQHAESELNEIETDFYRQSADWENNYMKIQSEMAEQFRQIKARLYSRYTVLLKNAKNEHQSKLDELENTRSFQLIQESEREVEEQKSLLEKAKKEAILGHFDEAKRLQQEARKIGVTELDARRSKIESDYNATKTQLTEEHNKEIEDLEEHHRLELAEQKAMYDQKKKELDDALSNELRVDSQKAKVRCKALTIFQNQIGVTIGKIEKKADDTIKKCLGIKDFGIEVSQSEKMQTTSIEAVRAKTVPSTVQKELKERRPSTSSSKLLSRTYRAHFSK